MVPNLEWGSEVHKEPSCLSKHLSCVYSIAGTQFGTIKTFIDVYEHSLSYLSISIFRKPSPLCHSRTTTTYFYGIVREKASFGMPTVNPVVNGTSWHDMDTQISAFKGRIKGQTIDPILDQTCTSFDLLDTYRGYRLVVNLGIIRRASKRFCWQKWTGWGQSLLLSLVWKLRWNRVDPDGPGQLWTKIIAKYLVMSQSFFF